MTTGRRTFLALAAGILLAIALPAGTAMAQVSVNPTITPVRNDGGWVYNMAFIFTVLGIVLFAIPLVALYVRYASRFQKDEDVVKVVRADRVLPGKEPPRRSVDLTQAVPVVVSPPAIPASVGAAAAPAAAAPAAAPAPSPAAPAAAGAQAASAPAAPAAEAPAAAAPEAEAPAPAAPVPAQEPPAPAAPVPAQEPPAAAPAAPAAPAPRVEVTMDQDTYDRVLAELLEKGTDRRVAEGQARRAGMIAARKAAEQG
jgi:hypothetical protein